MPENLLFEYAVIRIVPRVEREEFINAGVVLYCSKKRFLDVLYNIDEERIKAFCHKIDLQEVKEHLESFRQICEGGSKAGPIGRLDIASRFRWLTATRSTIVQTSKVHPGLCEDPMETLTRLHEQLVL